MKTRLFYVFVVVGVLLAALAVSGPAYAGTVRCFPEDTKCNAQTAPRPRPNPVTLLAPHLKKCVTTTWRAKHTHQPKTRPGEWCLLDDTMWLPNSWYIHGVWSPKPWYVVNRPVYLVVQRPCYTKSLRPYMCGFGLNGVVK